MAEFPIKKGDGAVFGYSDSKIGFFGTAAAARPAAYTISNHSDDRALNESGDTAAQIANVLGTLINDLKALGLLQ